MAPPACLPISNSGNRSTSPGAGQVLMQGRARHAGHVGQGMQQPQLHVDVLVAAGDFAGGPD